MGRPFQTKYNSCSTPAQVKLTRRHHPLEGQLLDVTRVGPVQVVVRLNDGTAMRLPRTWTNIDGDAALRAERICSVDSLREVLELLEALQRRA